MPRKPWWTGTLSDKLVKIQNFRRKIETVGRDVGLTPDQIAAAVALCDSFIAAFNFTEECKSTMQAATAWRDDVFFGEPTGNPAGRAPIFPVPSGAAFTRGTLTQFIELRELIVAMPGYTLAIGEELGLVGAEITPRPVDDVAPVFKKVSTSGYSVSLAGSMQGFDAMRLEYAPKGGNFGPVGFLTTTPGTIQITPARPGEAEMGQIRAIYIKKNAEVGNYSANYPVTIS